MYTCNMLHATVTVCPFRFFVYKAHRQGGLLWVKLCRILTYLDVIHIYVFIYTKAYKHLRNVFISLAGACGEQV